MAWCFQIGLPNASRCWAYRSESSRAGWPTPSAREATWIRPISRPRIIFAKPLPFPVAQQRRGRDAEVVEGELAAFHSLVAELGQVAGHGNPVAGLDQDDADAGVGGAGSRVGLAQQRDKAGAARIGDPGLRSVDDVGLPTRLLRVRGASPPPSPSATPLRPA